MGYDTAYIQEPHQENITPTMIETTLYDLVEAVNEAAGPEKEEWVPLIVARLLKRNKYIHSSCDPEKTFLR